VFQALILALWATFCSYDTLGPTFLYAGRPLIAGTVAGAIVGDPGRSWACECCPTLLSLVGRGWRALDVWCSHVCGAWRDAAALTGISASLAI